MPANVTRADIARVLEALAPEERLARMRLLLKGAPASLFWPVFLEWFPQCDDVWPHHRWLRPMLLRAGDSYPYMAPSEKIAFDALSGEQWVLRGAQSAHKFGLSWTTASASADYFARLHSTRGAQGHVYDAMIAKRDIFAVVQGEHGLTVLLNNTKLYEVNRVEAERTLGDRRPSFEPDGHYYDDNDDRRTAELMLASGPRAPAAGGVSGLSENVLQLPPIENMSQPNLLAALKQVEQGLLAAHDKYATRRLLKQRDRFSSELEARARGEQPGRVKAKKGGTGDWGQKGRSPGRPTSASKVITLPTRGRLLRPAEVRDDTLEDKAA